MSEESLSSIELSSGVPKWKKVTYGVGNLGYGIQNAILMFFQTAFLLEVARIKPVWVGNLMIIKQFWDGAVDPLIGILSENISTRWGKRKPLIVACVWPAAVMWVLMWSSPNLSEPGAAIRVAYYAACILLFSTFDSLVVVPYQSLIPDMSDGYHSRTFVVLFSQAFLFIGTGLSSFVWSYLIELFPVDTEDPEQKGMPYNYYTGYLVAAIVIVIPVIISYLISAFVAVERKDEEKKPIYPPTDDEDFVELPLSKPKKVLAWIKKQATDIKEIVTYLPFFVVLGFAIVNMVGTALFTGNFILWIKYDLEDESLTPASLLALQGSVVLFLFFWAATSRVIGKIPTYFVGGSIMIIGFILLFNINPRIDLWIYFCTVVLLGIGSSSGYLIVNSLVPDVVAMNERRTGKRREALFYSFYSFVGKVAQGLALLSSNYALGAVGYIPPYKQAQLGIKGQNDEVIETFSWLVSMVPLIFRLFGFIFAAIYFFVARREHKNLESMTQQL